jgi:peptidoglycan/LPS O-acetylase OafA/YrhL
MSLQELGYRPIGVEVNTNNYRSDIDGLRAVAIILVVLFHAGVRGLTGGFVGVDVFFVISGYLITRIIFHEIMEGNFSIIEFYRRRIRRLMPTLVVVLVACAVLGYYSMTPATYKQMLQTLWRSVVFGSNFYFANKGGYFDDPVAEHPLLHTWSLAVEEQFYIVWPFLLLGIARFKAKRPALVMIGGAIAMYMVGIAAVHFNEFRAFFLPTSRAWQLMAGASLALGMPAPRNSRIADLASVFGFALVSGAAVLFSSKTTYPGALSAVPTIGAALLIWSSSRQPSLIGRLLSGRSVVYVGLVSYALYLWHWPIFVFFKTVMFRAPSQFEMSCLIALSFCFAVISYHALEMPIRQGRLISKYSTFQVGGVLTAILLVFAAIGIRSAGFDGRYRALLSPFLVASVATSSEVLKCSVGKDENDSIGDLCALVTVANSRSVVLLWGDSHAGSIAPAFVEAAIANSATVLIASKAGCLPLIGVTPKFKYRDRMSSCRNHNARVIERAAKMGVTDVVLISRWNNYVLGMPRFGDEMANAELHLDDGNTAKHSLVNDRKIIQAGLERTILAINTEQMRAWFVEEVPNAGVLVTNYLSRALINGVALGTVSTFPAFPHFIRAAGVREIVERLPSAKLLTTINPASELCDSERCAIARLNTAIYADNHHLTVFGARQLVRIVTPVFQSATK